MPVPTCRGCGAEIVWGRTPLGKAMPLDPAPYDRDDESANVAAYRGVDEQLRCRVITAELPLRSYEKRAMPHFATCVAVRAQADKVPGVRSLDRARAQRARGGHA